MSGEKLLRQGDNGVEVQVLQQKLQSLGYSVTPDGNFGALTASAVEKFQEDFQDLGLTVDGIVGKGTALEIDKRLQNSNSSSGGPVIE